MSDPAVSAAREKAVDVLKYCYAHDLHTIDEFERRVGVVEHAARVRDIEEVLADIPADVRAAPFLPAKRMPSGVPTSRNPQALRTFMGSRTYRGDWLTSRSLDLKSIMAETVLDFRDVALPQEVFDLNVTCVMTSLVIRVPPSIRVDIEASPVFSEVKEKGGYRPDSHQGVIRVRGTIVFAEVKIKYR